LPTLRDPLPIRSVVLPNRLWFPPVARDLAREDGMVTDANVEGYRRVAGGGVGTVVVEHCFVRADGRYADNQIGANQDGCVPGLSRIAAAIRAEGAVPIVQLSFAGARTVAGRRVGPSPVPFPGGSVVPEELPASEIPGIIAAFENAVRRTRDAGFAGAEIHGAHGFLLSSFFSPLTNRRTDGYGATPEGRARLAIEVVRAARAFARDDFLIVLRLGATDGVVGGLSAEQAGRIAQWLEQAGVDIISVSGGLCGSRPTGKVRAQGYFFSEAKTIKAGLTIPVVGVGGVTDPAFARQAIERSDVDLVAVGRQILADPQWARRALAF
jgi:2,4-dienoyl-CoA reductase-like NADH-dependent reductase (Old Yellow Enzyme family)